MNQQPVSSGGPGSEESPSPTDGYDSTVRTTILCASCGQNLKGEPVVSTCPKCGTSYSARRAVSPSVYLPGLAEFPWTRLIAFIFTGSVASVGILLWVELGRKAMLPIVNLIPLAGVVLGGYALFLFPLLLRDLHWYVRHRRYDWMNAASIAEDRAQAEARRTVAQTQPASDRPPVLPSDETLERLAEEGHLTPIDWPALCATCGYRLQGLARRGICPECGSEYNARGHQMTGILSPYGGSRPWGDVGAAVFCAVVALLFLRSIINEFYVAKLVFGILFAAGAYGFAAVAWGKGRTSRFARQALKQLAAEEEEE